MHCIKDQRASCHILPGFPQRMTGKRPQLPDTVHSTPETAGYRQQVTDPNHLIAGRFFQIDFFHVFFCSYQLRKYRSILISHRIQIRPQNRFETRATCSEPISRQSPVSHVIAWTLTRCSHNLPQLCQSFFLPVPSSVCIFQDFLFPHQSWPVGLC